jgi:hypothetical protein
MLESVEWLFAKPSERQLQSAATMLFTLTGTLALLIFVGLPISAAVARALPSWGFPLDRFTGSIVLTVFIADTVIFGSLGGYLGFLLGRSVDRRVSKSQRHAIHYASEALRLSVSFLLGAWWIYSAVEGRFPPLLYALAGVILLAFGLSSIAPLRARFRMSRS